MLTIDHIIKAGKHERSFKMRTWCKHTQSSLHKYEHGEIDMVEMPGSESPTIGYRVDTCPCGDTRAVQIEYRQHNTDE